jgi:hypothetical protein
MLVILITNPYGIISKKMQGVTTQLKKWYNIRHPPTEDYQ